jgi:hypothetical protein
MDERFRGKGIWVGLGVLAIIFLCLMMCGAGVMVMLGTRVGPAYGVVPQVQPPAAEEGAAPPAIYHGYGGSGLFAVLSSGIGLLFKLLFFGLILFLLFGLARRLFWGHRHWCPPYPGQPPEGKDWKGQPHAPWAWHHYRQHGRPPPWWSTESEPAADEGEPNEAEE